MALPHFPGFGGAEVRGGIFQQPGAWKSPVLGHELWLQATETDSGHLKEKKKNCREGNRAH